MNQYEYEVIAYPADAFREVVYFCSESGECSLAQVPSAQLKKIETALNERGRKGWELVHVAFGKDGILAFWKRAAESHG